MARVHPQSLKLLGVFALTLLAFLLFVIVVAGLVDQWRTTRWPATTGTILECGVRSHSFEEHGRSAASYTPWARYGYHLDGQDYEGDRLSFVTLKSRSGREVEELLETNGIAAGARVDVFYDPEDPGRSVLIRTARMLGRTAWVTVVVTLLATLGALVQLVAEIKEWRWRRWMAST